MVSSAAQITPSASAYSVQSAYSTQSSTQTTATSSTKDQMNQFMLMMMAQLKNQNPMDPMQDNDMLGQMAQLNSLNELQSLDTKLQELLDASQIGYASSLVGKTVTAQLSDQDPIQGVVTSVTNADGSWTATIGNQNVPLANIIQVGEAAKS